MSDTPAGYTRHVAGGVEVVALDAELPNVMVAIDATRARTLYAYAAAHPDRREMRGRAPVYSAPLPGSRTRAVVRHAWHGGLLAPLTRDLFAPPTRAPHELRTAVRLAAAGVPTPEIVAFATYRAPLGMRRGDVLTREVPDAHDLAAVLIAARDDDEKSAALVATATLLRALADAGALHPDLNIKNVLLSTNAAGALTACVLDVDRVLMGPGGSRVADSNLARLERSIRKWRTAGRIDVRDRLLTALRTGHRPAGAMAR